MSTAVTAPQRQQSLLATMATRFGIEPTKLFETLKATAFKGGDRPPTNEEFMALMVVANQHGLNPFTREIYAFPDKQRGIVPVVGVDGWSRITNEHPQMDGVEFRYAETEVVPDGSDRTCPEWVECTLYRKDRVRPVVVREYLDECYRPGSGNYKGPWQTHPKRFLRHKAFIQASRLAFGFSGITDADDVSSSFGPVMEGEVVRETPTTHPPQTPAPTTGGTAQEASPRTTAAPSGALDLD